MPSAFAQDPADPGAAIVRPSRSAITAASIGPDRPVGLWAGGSNYKVRFDGGMTFYPHVGAALPHQPVHWRTASVRAGGVELLTGDEPRTRHDAFRCEYDFGAVTERYDVLGDGLAQSFVIAQRPPTGELVVTGEMTTPLQVGNVAAAHAPLTLALADGRAVVEYGAATAIDARGTSTPMTTAVEGNRVVLRLAAEAVAAASFPLVIDPLLSNTLLRQGAAVDDVDVLHESLSPVINSRVWVAESRTVAAGDNDVHVYRFGPGFTGVGFEVFNELSPFDTTNPRLALAPAAGAAGRVVVVTCVDDFVNHRIYLHAHDVNNVALQTGGYLVPTAGGESHWRPDVGGRLAGGGNRVLIVYQREAVSPFAETATSDVQAAVFDAANLLFAVAPFTLRTLANRDQERPVVNQSAATNDWLVAFQEHNGNAVNDDWDIEMLSVSGAGAVGPTALTTSDATDVSLHKVGPQIAGSSGRYALTYATRVFDQLNPKPTSPEGEAVRAQRVDWDLGTNTGSLPWSPVDLFTPGSVTVRATGIAFDPVSTSHWCASLRYDLNTSYRIYKLGYTGGVVETGTLPLAPAATPRALAVAFNEDYRQFQIVFSENDGSAATNLLQGTVMTYDAVAAPALLGFACGAGVWGNVAAISSRQQIGAQGMPLQLVGAPIDSAAILFVSSASVPVDGTLVGAPGCTLFPDVFAPNYLGSPAFTIVGGAASTLIDVPTNLAPMTLTMQWIYLVPGANPIGLQASEGLSVQLGR